MITSFRHDKQRIYKRRRLFGIVLALSIVVFLVRVPLSGLLGGVLVIVGKPVWSMSSAVTTSLNRTKAMFASKQKLEEENDGLRADLAAIALEAYTYEETRKENEALKAKLGRFPEQTLLLARVLSSPASSPYDTLVVDAGTDHGVDVGMNVVSEGDFVIGEISRVWKNTSLVTLYTSPGSEVSVLVGSSTVPGVAHGTGGGNFRIILPKGTPVEVGDVITMPALSPEPVGVVGGISRPEGSSLQALYVRLPMNIYELKSVYVTRTPSERVEPDPKGKTQ